MADRDQRAGSDGAPDEPARLSRPLVIGLVAAGVLIVLGGIALWLHERHYESTDDAFVDGHLIQISARIPGRVEPLLIRDNEEVRAGQLLIELDPRDQQVRLDQARAQRALAEAQLAQAEAQLSVRQANRLQAAADVESTEADLAKARDDVARYAHVDRRAVSQQDIDAVDATFRAQTAKLASNRAAVAADDAQVDAAKTQVEAARASLGVAATQVADAELQLSYTRIVAPESGRVTHRTVETGNYVTAGQPLFDLVPDDMWVTANFKETQLAHMRPGQPVDIAIDAFPDVTFHGHVDSFQRGTGSALSILPPENATGNYVKVVQRLPVKIVFDDNRVKDYPLAPGQSVEPTVTVR